MRRFYIRLMVLFLVFLLIVSVMPITFAEFIPKDFRAVWVSSVYGIDYPLNASKDEVSLKKQADEILDGAKEMGMNAVILQVRPCSDSLYDSDIFPWSKYLTGAQGISPENGFDPLSYWVREAHKRGLELHAWINPFRVANSDADFEAMVDKHPAKLNPSWVVRHTDGKYYFNPGMSETRSIIISGAKEIIDNYDVDGLHMDDYFYPGIDFDDEETYIKFGSDFDDIGDWRRNNIDLLVSEMNSMVKASGKDISFGISPAGIWANSSNMPDGSDTSGRETYYTAYADTKKWVKEGWVDYICPQLYWHIGHSLADYKTLVKWWAETVSGTDVKLYIGMADYQAGNSDPESPWRGIDTIRDEINLNSTIKEISGEVHFSYQSIANYPELKSYYSAIYNGGNEPEYKPLLDKINHSAYIKGDNGRFYPENSLSRAEASALFSRLMVDEKGNPSYDENMRYPAVYTDVADDAWYSKEVGFISMYGIMKGYQDGSFMPERNITRAEFAVMISRFDTAKSDAETGFWDVPKEHWAAQSIAHAKEKGYLSGYEDGSFKPERSITRAEAVKIINRLLGRNADSGYINEVLLRPSIFSDVSVFHWAYEDILEASVGHEYSHINGAEKWEKAEELPQIKPNNTIFVSDSFTFVEPELITQGELVPLDLKGIEAVAVHHMAHPTASFRDVEQWHLERGFDAIGYNFWIGLDGMVYVGRGFNRGAAVANKNSKLISIGFQGDYDGAGNEMPSEQFEAGVELIKWLDERLVNINRVGGHSDYAATECPGSRFPLEEMVARALVRWRIGLG